MCQAGKWSWAHFTEEVENTENFGGAEATIFIVKVH